MVHALGWHGLVFIDTVGHCAGAILFGLLIVLLLRDANFRVGARNRLSLVAALLVFSWNVVELIVLQAGPPLDGRYRFAIYFSVCCLSILPAVLLHISLGTRLPAVSLTGYAVSVLSIASQYPGHAPVGAEQSRFSLLLLTFGFALLSLGVWLAAEIQMRRHGNTESPNRLAFLSLFILSTSYFHFQSDHTSSMWVGEAIWHHASIPIALLVLLQDYRFFLLDVFLRFTVSATWIALWVWAAYSLNNYLQIGEKALTSEFVRAIVVTCVGVLVYLLARSLSAVQRIFTSVAFRRLPVESLLDKLQTLPGEDEARLLEEAAAAVAQHFRCSRWQVQTAVHVELETGPAILDGSVWAGREAPPWAALALIERFVQGGAHILYLGPRAGGQRFLSEDLQDLRRVAAAMAERIERFRNDELARLVSQAELRALQAQINPHFLFNALNTLYGTIGRDSPEARQLVLNLAEVFRARLQTNRTFVALNEELELVRAYLEIEGLRLGNRLQTQMEIDSSVGEVLVPVLSIQPLVENAVRHGANRAGNVQLTLFIQASGAGSVAIRVSDGGPGFGAKAAQPGTGTGLDNVRKRLSLCYGEECRLGIYSTSEGATVVFSVPTKSGGRHGVRTHDPHVANVVLSQLS